MVNKIGGMTRKCTNLWEDFITARTFPNGSKITVNADKSVTVHKVSGDDIYITSKIHISGGVYSLSNIMPEAMSALVISITDVNGTAIAVNNYAGSGTLVSGEATISFYWGSVGVGDTTLHPMLNEGATALPYEPYFEGLRSAKVTMVKSVGGKLNSVPIS